VGVNSAILSPSRGNIGIGFAIPVNLAASIMNSLIATGGVARGYLGVRSPDSVTADVAEQLGLPRDTRGVLVTDIDPGSPAEKAGLKRTDVILSLDGHPVNSAEDMRLRISQMVPGTRASLKVARDGKEKTLDVVLEKLAENPDELFPGVNVTPLTSELRRRLGIDSPIPGLMVMGGKFLPGVVVFEVNRVRATDLATAKAALKAPGEANLITYYFRGVTRYMTITVPKQP
jgi:membrane-associated protease RseP (regulator of RpoE activity)